MKGFFVVVFTFAVLPQESNERIKIEVEGDFSQMDGTIFSIKGPWKVVSTLVANNDTKVWKYCTQDSYTQSEVTVL